MGKWIKNEKGLAVVEATLLLPFCFIMIIALYYAAIFMCQKANLQANVQNALIYYKQRERSVPWGVATRPRGMIIRIPFRIVF